MKLYKNNPPKFFTQNNSFIVTLKSMNVLNEIESTIPVENTDLTEQEKTLIDYLKKEKVNEFTRQNVKKY